LLDAASAARRRRPLVAGLRGLRAYVGPLTSNVDARPAARGGPSTRCARRPPVGVPGCALLGQTSATSRSLVARRRADGPEAYAGRLAAWDELLAGVGERGRGSGEAARTAAEQARTALLAAGTDADRVGDLLGRGEAGAPARR
jgi:hypothetical protein